MHVAKINLYTTNYNKFQYCGFSTNPSFKAKIHDYICYGYNDKALAELSDGNLNSENWEKGETPLMTSIDDYNEYMFDVLMTKKGLDINKQDKEGDTALHYAAKRGNLYAMEKLLARGDIDVNIRNEYNRTPLLETLYWEHPKTALMLINRMDTDINAVDKEKESAFSYAFDNKMIDVIKALLNREDFDINVKQGYFEIPIWCLNLYGKDIDLFKDILDRPDISKNASNEALIHYANNGDAETVSMLLEKQNADVNVQTDSGWTALMEACNTFTHSGTAEVVERLLECPNINLLLENDEGKTALDYAKERQRINLKLPDEVFDKLERMTKEQKENPKSGGFRKIAVDIDKLSPEENIWSKKEITKKFIHYVEQKKYDLAFKMLEITPLIDITKGNGVITTVGASGHEKLIEKLFDYKFHKQKLMLKDYKDKRKKLLNELKMLSYQEMKQNQIILNTDDGFGLIYSNPEFKPNDRAVDGQNLFEKACMLGSAPYARDMLSKFADIDTTRAVNTKDEKIKQLINKYEKTGKYIIELANIRTDLRNPETEISAVQRLKKLIMNPAFDSAITDDVGNSVLHTASSLNIDGGRGIIQISLNRGIDINSKNVAGQTPLMVAVKQLLVLRDDNEKSNILSNIKFLLDKGANVDEQDKLGQTALHYACSTLSTALLVLLLSKSPNLAIKDLNGNIAAKYLKTDAMKEVYKQFLL